jgi:hypothetical protein
MLNHFVIMFLEHLVRYFDMVKYDLLRRLSKRSQAKGNPSKISSSLMLWMGKA